MTKNCELLKYYKQQIDILYMMNSKNVIFVGNKFTDLCLLNKIKMNKKCIFLNVFTNKNTINLESFFNYHKKNSVDCNIYLFIGKYFKEIANILKSEGYVENIDFFDGNFLFEIIGINNTPHYYNWWPYKNPENEWFSKFVKNNCPKAYGLNFYSVFGNRKIIEKHSSRKNIFFSGENVQKRYTEYKDYCINNVGLAMGFDELDNSKYLRFPLWICYVFAPDMLDYDIIKGKINSINKKKNTQQKEGVLIASHDIYNTRAPICDSLSNILDIKYAGIYRNNTDELKIAYNDNKINYLSMFKFNICPENTNTKNYVTEKIFEAFMGGSIPIYTGSNNNPEPEIINKDAVIFWDLEGDNNSSIALINDLQNNHKMYNEFMDQTKLLPYSADYVYEKLVSLKERLLNL